MENLQTETEDLQTKFTTLDAKTAAHTTNHGILDARVAAV